MSLDKSITHGKEHRKLYRGAKAIGGGIRMTDEQKCIVDLYMLIEDITDKAEKRDLSLIRPTSGIGGGIYLGRPPICRIRDNFLEKHGDIIYQALKQKEIEEERELRQVQELEEYFN